MSQAEWRAYLKQRKPEVKRDHPNWKNNQITKHIGRGWQKFKKSGGFQNWVNSLNDNVPPPQQNAQPAGNPALQQVPPLQLNVPPPHNPTPQQGPPTQAGPSTPPAQQPNLPATPTVQQSIPYVPDSDDEKSPGLPAFIYSAVLSQDLDVEEPDHSPRLDAVYNARMNWIDVTPTRKSTWMGGDGDSYKRVAAGKQQERATRAAAAILRALESQQARAWSNNVAALEGAQAVVAAFADYSARLARAERANIAAGLQKHEGISEAHANITNIRTRIAGIGGSLPGAWVAADLVHSKDAQDRFIARVFAKLDENGDVVGRTVIKVVNTTHHVGATPSEIVIHQLVSNAASSAGCGYVLGLHNFAVLGNRSGYWMQLPFSPHGDLEKVLEVTPSELPEPFLWYVFKAMTEACLILYQGGLDNRSGDEWAGDKEIVHADIKLANVFLAAPRPEDFEVYPTPQMADFGSAFISEKETQTILMIMWVLEQLAERDMTLTPAYANEPIIDPDWNRTLKRPDGNINIQPPENRQLLSYTNVWQVGLLIWSLMHRQFGTGMALDFIAKNKQQPPKSTLHYSGSYSDQLESLVYECLNMQPRLRPSLQELRTRIERNLDALRQRYDDWVSKPQAGTPWSQQNFDHKLHFRGDVYFPVGQAPQIPQRHR
ncbi:hypothetical protein H2199_001086 [Coniosporium tulheliwenetii]|uniref:Uncharacterized protein n=1 Tax=Coniosporium tulheliwenetii TaxID=3383036 RepID=A0ACC2ZKY9_9PEZI|nr:hypothetical protein H2199_001086 [Cladosporium sp. JES 115]